MATSNTFGKIDVFNPEVESFAAYRERVELFFVANNITGDRKVAVLLSIIGTKNFSLLRDLLSPEKPSDKTVKELLDVLTKHLEPERVVIAERFKFHQRTQQDSESIASFVAELKRLASTCNFGNNLDDSLRDRFVCGLRSTGAQKKLLGKKDLTFEVAVETATAYEVIESQAHSIKEAVPLAGSIKQEEEKSVLQVAEGCYRCGKMGHSPSTCRVRTFKCHNCGKVGHLAAVCRQPFKPNRTRQGRGTNVRRSTRWIGKDQEEADRSTSSDSEELGLYHIHRVKQSNVPPITVAVTVNDKLLDMELDTGAAVSVISKKTWERLIPSVPIKPSKVVLSMYSSERLPTLGKCEVNVRYKDQARSLDLVVVEGNGPSLLGRDWLRHLQLDWPRIAQIQLSTRQPERSKAVEDLLAKYTKVFSKKVGVMKQFKAKLQLKEEAQPKYHRARPVPFAIKEAVGQELDCLESEGIIEKVESSEWAAPIVVVPKRDGRLRLCGDYKVSINPYLKVDAHPLPRAEGLFARLSGGKRFTKLDLSQAYQQMPLDASSEELVTINTHQGLYRYKRLPFGVASAPAIFQRTMDSILQGIDKVTCFIDDILITGENDEDHLKRLQIVLERLQAHGIVLKRDKCSFMGKSVEYLGHRIDCNGLHTTPDKLKAILEAPPPRNVQELRSFLGLLNYYNKFIPQLASIIHPLNNLLRHHVKWVWSAKCSSAMEKAKQALVSTTLLVHFDPNLPLRLATDASSYGVGAVLSHRFPDGREQPIAFASRSLSPSERNYAQIEKEALSLIFGVRKFHQYLYGKSFVLVTDHKPLTTLLGPKTGIPTLAASRMQRWALILSAYSYTIEYRATNAHGNADALSRLPLPVIASTEITRDVNSRLNLVQMATLPLTHVQLRSATRRDPLLSRVLEFVKEGWPKSVSEDLSAFWRRRLELTVEADCLLWGTRVVVPSCYRERMLRELHTSHLGMSRMKALGRGYVWGPGMDCDIERLVRSCALCVDVKASAVEAAPLHPWVWPTRPWQRIHIDFAGPLHGKMYLLIVDSHSKWPEAWAMPSITTQGTVSVLKQLFSTYGLPEEIVSDNGPQFIASEFAEFIQSCGIKHHRSAPYHPATNGAVERLVKTFKEAMKIGEKEGRKSQEVMYDFLLWYRSIPHPVTQLSPATLFLNRPLRTRLDLLKPKPLEDQVLQKQVKNKVHHDAKRTKWKTFSEGENVWVRDYRQRQPRWVEGVVLEVLGQCTYQVKLMDGNECKRHVEQLKRKPGTRPTEINEQVPGASEVDDDDVSIIEEGNSTSNGSMADVSNPSAEGPCSTETPAGVHRYPRRERRPPSRPGFVSTF